ncbi:MAG: antifreeze protein [Gammaproteobacteria bacterium]|nr:MAG: antifreeze protein [Gammaproteobacteria bacterium]
MGIFNRLSSEFVDIIEWTQLDSDTMVYRYPRYRNEIKYGAKLTVREGQTAVLVNEGKIADVFLPGIYELKTANLPILSTLQNWQHGFESPFKAEVYFFNTTHFVDLKWGTKQAVALPDNQFGMVRLRAFGSYTLGVKDPAKLLRSLVGTDGNFEINEISRQLTNVIVTAFPEVLAESRIGVLELPTRYSELAERLRQRALRECNRYGVAIGRLYIESISLPENVQKVLDEKTGMNIIGDDLNDYAKYQASQGMAKGGAGADMASAGMGMAMGINMAREIAGETASSMSNATDHSAPEMPPEPPVYYLIIVGERQGPMPLSKVYELLTDGVITPYTLIWRKGMPEWQTLEQTPEIDLGKVLPSS